MEEEKRGIRHLNAHAICPAHHEGAALIVVGQAHPGNDEELLSSRESDGPVLISSRSIHWQAALRFIDEEPRAVDANETRESAFKGVIH